MKYFLILLPILLFSCDTHFDVTTVKDKLQASRLLTNAKDENSYNTAIRKIRQDDFTMSWEAVTVLGTDEFGKSIRRGADSDYIVKMYAPDADFIFQLGRNYMIGYFNKSMVKIIQTP
jgi:hypothetical protein